MTKEQFINAYPNIKINIFFIPILSAKAPKYGEDKNIALLIIAKNTPDMLLFKCLSSIRSGVAGWPRLYKNMQKNINKIILFMSFLNISVKLNLFFTFSIFNTLTP